MDVKLLLSHEVLIECWVRGIAVKSSDIAKIFPQLESTLKLEWDGKIASPTKPHMAAIKNPNKEITLCFSKLDDVKTVFKNGIRDQENRNHLLDICHSRLHHVNSRLNRLSNLPNFRNIVNKVKGTCESFIQLTEEILSEAITAEECIAELDNIFMDIPTNENILEYLSNFCDDTSQENDDKDESLSSALSYNLRNIHINSTEPMPGCSTDFQFSQNRNTNNPSSVKENITLPSIKPSFTPITAKNLSSSHRHSEVSKGPHLPSKIMSNWNTYFDGVSQDTSITEFLFRVEHLAKINFIPLQDLTENLFVLLKGIAQKYYWFCVRTI